MALNLLKLSVGPETVEDLEGFIAQRMLLSGADVTWHQTRMVPKRRDELLDGGSIYWVIKGQICARQVLLDIVPFTDESGIGRCRLILDPVLVRTERHPKRPFQGWRYLKPDEAPADFAGASEDDGLPREMRDELSDLGLF
ncbi:DUF1489 domain-containing protein [Fulvimarina sp. 2208YS6-2-32]|uniref:DUF1489 domain-containing protein n=1 Tax=Fulvimarina uroteuthidis TaxID=3098149 RepID=A0ABU5I2J8_9HYPH|nr:DUF1489 domain-containing protein [Fulvimarina sp. 2208YS6-2-32]MDY8109591.1 DUF1489 domain-containing protein [Fulvimarina sp. 2208YS6-2-32]